MSTGIASATNIALYVPCGAFHSHLPCSTFLLTDPRVPRPLLFLDTPLLASPSNTTGLPPLIVLHHILVRSPISLPHTLHGWAEAEYVRWVNEHSEQEAWTLVEGDLTHWEKVAEAEATDTDAAAEYVQLARTVLANANAAAGSAAAKA